MTLRLLLYCHNVFGLGHIARSLQIAEAAAEQGTQCTLVTGCRALDSLTIDRRVRIERLPAVRLENGIRFVADDTTLVAENVMEFRSRRILEATLKHAPDVVLVDHNPFGLSGELVPTLVHFSGQSVRPKFVWGVPYSEGLSLGPQPPGNPRLNTALRSYCAAIGYTDRNTHDVFEALPDWALPKRRHHVGWVATRPSPRRPSPEKTLVILCGGGGADAIGLVRQVLTVRERSVKLRELCVRVVAGPLADLLAVRALCSEYSGVEVISTSSVRDAVVTADVVVTRAGYNTCATLAATDLPIVFVPFTQTRGDQPERARQMARLPGVWNVDETRPDSDSVMARALEAALNCTQVQRPEMNLTGAASAARYAMEMVELD